MIMSFISYYLGAGGFDGAIWGRVRRRPLGEGFTGGELVAGSDGHNRTVNSWFIVGSCADADRAAGPGDNSVAASPHAPSNCACVTVAPYKLAPDKFVFRKSAPERF